MEDKLPMNRLQSIILIVLALIVVPGYSQDYLAPELQAFQPFIGKTWQGVFRNSTPEKPMVDISHWERALNGNAIRIMHSVNEGEYGGESIIFWDKEKQSLVYYYFTTAGFFTHGTMSFEDSAIVSHEMVSGNENGITEVKSTGTILPDGRMLSKSRYLQNGQWVDGHEITYVEDAQAQVIFR
jgi:hypothetical protein